MKINNFSEFDRIVCLCLDIRYNNWEVLEKQFTSRGGVVERFLVGKGEIFPRNCYNFIDPVGITVPPVCHSPNSYYCHLSHREILKKALDDNVSNILMLEDDCKLLDNFDEVTSKISEQMEKLDLKWDMFYFSGCIHELSITEYVSENIKRCMRDVYAWHCVAINQQYHNMIEEILKLPQDRAFDYLCGKFIQTNPDFHCYVAIPPVAIQEEGFSNILGYWIRKDY